ncbi:MAG: bestrophin family protein, partial [Gemmataceae bacterium]|nr:bestrophin family protein [Gemmataceae bacterium]
WLLPLAISGRLWLVVVVAAGYTAGVCHLGRTVLTAAPVWVDEFAVINALVIGVLVGFRTKTAYDRWWEGRSLWGALTNNVRNLCLKAVALADPPAADRRELFRLAAGFPVALLRHLRGPVTLAEVPGFENDEAAPAHVPAALAGRVFGLIASWRRAGHIDGHAQQLLDAHAAALMDVCGACEKVRHTPLPGSYLTLLRHGLILGLLVIPWHLAYAVGFWAVPAQVLIVYFLVGVELVAEEVEQPFGFDGDDLPLERYAATMRANAAEILGCE